MVGDYSLPNLKLPQQPEVTLGRYAQMRRKFLKEHQSPLLQSPDEGRTDTALGGSGTESQQDGETILSQMAQKEGVTEQMKAEDMMKWVRLMNSQLGTGNRESGSDIRLEYMTERTRIKSLPFFGRDEVINEILRTTPHLSASLEEIKDYYERNPDNKDRYIKYFPGGRQDSRVQDL